MGWTFYHRDKGETNFEHFRQKFEVWTDENPSPYKLLDMATVRGGYEYNGVCYGAVLDTRPDEQSVTAVVMLTKWVPGDYYNFGYKDMDEFMGPCEVRCPERIMKLLTPLAPRGPEPVGNGYKPVNSAHDWRDACWANIERRRKAKTVRPGDIVRFANVLRFGNGAEMAALRFVKRDHFVGLPLGGRYNIPGWREREFEIERSA